MIGTLLLNRYELLEIIGEGGMGIVYKAKCHLLNRFVAIKILKKELSSDEDFVSRFKREGTSAASLSHANIVNVHDVGTDNHTNFIVMEYINGKTLKQLIKENVRLTSQITLEISLQIAKALQCAHKNNIIHRDIKPDNIMITEDNIVKVTDFGIAKVADSRTMTNSSKVVGTAHYFSPEQAKGNVVDCRTDIYSLGIVMYEMVTGKVPYNADSAISIAMMHIQEPVIPPKEIIEGIPENVNQVILKAMEKSPIKRYQTASEMGDIIELIKENPNFKVISNKRESNTTKIMGAAIASSINNDSTTFMSQGTAPKTPIIEKNKKVLSKNSNLSTNKKAMIIIASIILVMAIGVLVKFLSDGSSTNASTPIVETTKENENLPATDPLPEVKNKFVPSLIGNTIEVANQNILNNEFSIGNVSNNFSDNIAKGLVISQFPNVNTSYEKGGKIDFVISQGKKIKQVAVPELTGKSLDEAEEILDDIQLELGEETLVKKDNKTSKDKHSKNDNKDDNKEIFMQSAEADTLVDIGTKINVSYYESK
ncbi:Stk1 family PASTA domain-containing Ser/Thr kinase [Clostridium sp.]|uniref:Stk1 family PASTA domain-containing Ser/Thr kinase n=1 Tax=Clostridium sp. TaxID=1506 RepID=UPI001A466A7F|nr:Stk1 family PASTA domain-containing Ser/Thr kinase [Clostridium sp.]MBK5235866.1 Stk1 family PASTA domain-containing Ser/Thr kinase [Clostridium sp.]